MPPEFHHGLLGARPLPTFVLSFHSAYGCASSGACCTSGWDIAVEPEVAAGLRSALGRKARALRGVDGRTLLAHDASGRCAFFEAGRTCAIHRRLGHDALPVSCRLFPRVCLLTPRGVSITLSHYCPTAAALLFAEEAPPRIVEDAPGFPAVAYLEGLDAREGPPPLLRPGVWLGWDGHAAWERHAIDVLGRDGSPDEALDLLAAQADAARGWTVEDGPFLPFLERALAGRFEVPPRPREDALCATVDAAVPPSLRAPSKEAPPVPLDAFAGPVRRYLAARAFASWAAVQGAGLRTSVVALRAALAVLRREAARGCAEAGRSLDRPILVEALRRSDLLLAHLVSPEALAAGLARWETESGRP